jgi:hypothetical protein
MEIKFQIRCSAIGQLMTNSKKKDEVLGETAKTYLKAWLKSRLYNKKSEHDSVYTMKGKINEDEAIDMVAKRFGYNLLIKNTVEYTDHPFLRGTPDILPGNDSKVFDVKNSWSWETFPLFESEIPTIGYDYQLKGYMELTGRKEGYVVYCLTNTPDKLIERTAYYKCLNDGYDQMEIDVYNEMYENMTYFDTPQELRMKVFEVVPDPDLMFQIETRVFHARDYLNSLCEMLKLDVKII